MLFLASRIAFHSELSFCSCVRSTVPSLGTGHHSLPPFALNLLSQHQCFPLWLLACFRALDVDVDNPHTGRASLVAIAKAAGVTSPLVNYEQVGYDMTA